MQVSTIFKYLFGNRQAVIDVANCRHSVWLGMLFVFAAGFAREYDGEDLLHEPWHLALPLGASLLTSFLLFVLVDYTTRKDNQDQDEEQATSFGSKYRAFLGLYWMTAPLALLYAMPAERFLDGAGAVKVNLWLLGIVSLWRVALMTRVIQILYAPSMVAAFFIVMLFADTVAMGVFWLTPLPIMSIMGGIRLTDSERLIQDTGFMVRFWGTVTWPVWVIGVCCCLRNRVASHDVELNQQKSATCTWGTWVLATCSLLIWPAILPFTQGEQINRRRVEIDLRAGRIEDAIQYMSQRNRDDFPPHWEPPPRVGYGETQPPVVEVLLQLEISGVPWVKSLYREKLAVQARANRWDYYSHAIKLTEMDDERLASYVKLLDSAPEGPAMARYHETEIQASLDPEQYGDGEVASEELSDNRRASLEAILTLLPDDE